jgi:hypothetical protein
MDQAQLNPSRIGLTTKTSAFIDEFENKNKEFLNEINEIIFLIQIGSCVYRHEKITSGSSY